MTATLAVSPLALAAYLQNVVDGRPMREIARDFACEPSTILRRIRKCEELRDHPEWESILSALEEHRAEADAPPRGLPERRTVLAALGLTAGQARGSFAKELHILRHPSALVLVGEAPRAAITESGEVKGNMPRAVVLAALAFGWLAPHGGSAGRVRKFRITEAAIEAIYEPQMLPPAEGEEKPRGAAKYGPMPNPIEALLRRNQDLITVDHLRTAQRFQLVYLHRESTTADTYAEIARALPPRLLMALDEVCGKGTGFEALEGKMKLPARSAKAIVALALEAVAHTGVAA